MTAERKKRAFFVINSLVGGGAERVFATVVSALHAAEVPWRIEVVLLDALPEAYPLPPGVVLHQLDCRESFGASVRQLLALTRRERPDVLVSFLNRGNCAAVVAGRLLGIPAVISERVHTTSHFGRGLSAAANRLAVRALYPQAERVITVAHGVADDLVARYGVRRDRIEVIYNPFERDEILRRATAEPDLALPQHYWLGVGRLVPNKNFAMLLKAFALADPPGDLVILGEGPERPALQALAGSLGIAGRVHLPGFAANPFAAMRGARAYLSASNAEGFPNALVEALVLGVPVAATDCDSGPGEILQGRSAAKVSAMTEAPHGILVPTEDERAMAAAIRLLTDDDARGRFAAAAARRALDFDRDSAIRRYGEVVDAALATRDRRPAG